LSLEQAVILVGGRGERLRPLTDRIPKPLAPVNGKPFLNHLLDQLKAQGIKRVLLLLGYQGHQFQRRYKASYRRLSITYSIGTEADSQGERLFHALFKLDERFLLCYGDTLVPDFDLSAAMSAHSNAHSEQPSFDRHRPLASLPLITLGAVPKRPGNVSLEPGGSSRYYMSPSQTISMTDVGYMIVEKEAIEDRTDLPNLLQRLGLLGRLGAYPVERQLTIDTPELLAETEQALAALSDRPNAFTSQSGGRGIRPPGVL
jgi:NDP-sugar pyrophosphorylase family protein